MIPIVGNFDVKPIFANAVRAATVYGPDLDVIDYINPGLGILDAIAQGSGITSDIKLQISPDLALGSSYVTEGATDKALNLSTSGKTKIGVQFTQSGVRQIKTIALRLKRVGAITAGKILTLTLNANSTGDPGTVLGTAATVLCSSIGTSYEWVTFTFATPVDLADSTVYHIVLTSDYDASDTLYIAWNALTVASGGNCEDYAPSSWADVATLNLMFYAMQYNFADITGGAFTQVVNAASLQSKVININAGRFIRAKNTVAGGSATGATSVNLVMRKKDTP
jgi:hypothetical protein